jgi:rhamnose transport system ATP-binding protein
MRDGAYISTHDVAETSVDELVRQMVGRDVTELFPKKDARVGEELLRVEGLTSPGLFHDISFSVREGEIVALAGLVGAGRSEVVRAVFGVDEYESGAVSIGGKRIPAGRPTAAMAAGLALVPEDRRKQGLVIDSTVGGNTAMAMWNRISRFGLLTTGMEHRAARPWAAKLEVKSHALDTVVGTLSGGNQQKVVLAKWLATAPRVLIVDEPTRGIDVGTKSSVHALLSDLAAQGLGIVMISSELPEVLGMADRVLVMHEGRITAEIDRADATSENVVYAATHASGDHS